MISQTEYQLLLILLQNKEYLPLEKLCNIFHISNRTLLRKLNLIEDELKKYNLELERKRKLGIKIVGADEDKNNLMTKLEKKAVLDYKNKDERQKRLIFELLDSDELEKIYYYADKLKVSESTISQDLLKIENWFINFNIKIQRIKGNGLQLKYEELDFRKATLSCNEEMQKLVYITEEEKNRMEGLILDIFPEIVQELTVESCELYIEYITLIAKRIAQGKHLNENEIKKLFKDNEEKKIGNKELEAIYEKIEEDYQIKLNESERIIANLMFKSRKNREINLLSEDKAEEEKLMNLIYGMIDVFDQKMSFNLKEDSEFIEGLITHLKPAILRFKYDIPVKTKIELDIVELYPDIYSKTKEAIKILEKKLQTKISEEEIILLSYHFGSAVLKLNSKNNTRRKVKIGVVCGSGIGISSLIKSRLKNIFKDKIEVKTFNNKLETYVELEKMDFVVTTFYITDLKVPTIKIDVLFDNEQLEKINELVEYCMYLPVREETLVSKKKSSLYKILDQSDNIREIVENLKIYEVDNNLNLDELIKEAARLSHEDLQIREIIEERLIAREKLYTQVLEDFNFTFLHTELDELDRDIFFILRPRNKRFEDEVLESSKSVVVMLRAKKNKADETPLKDISTEIFEDEKFHEMILEAGLDEIVAHTESILEKYLKEYIKNKS